MSQESYQVSFETEVENYRKLTGVPGIPQFTTVEWKKRFVQDLLMFYIEEFDL